MRDKSGNFRITGRITETGFRVGNLKADVTKDRGRAKRKKRGVR